MRSWRVLVCLMLAATVLTACGAAEAIEAKVTRLSETDAGYENVVLDTRFEGALDIAGQLALGTLQLEETELAVTEEQAETLLPLWQALQGGGVTAEDEVNAVLKGIEGAMTEDQLATIADMALTDEDMQAWMEEQELGAGGGFLGAVGDPDARATRQAESGGQGMPPSGQMPANDEMATRMAEFQNMSEEEREAMRATAQADGGVRAGPRGGAGDNASAALGAMGQLRFLLRPLITTLEARTGEA